MKIYTESITFEMTLDEFENILDNEWLQIMIDTIVNLSVKIDEAEDAKLTAALNQIVQGSLDQEYFSDIEEDDEECGDYDEEENDTVNRLYETLICEKEYGNPFEL